MADVTIKNVRFSYCHLFQPKSQNGSDPKYSTTVLVPKSNTAAKQAIDATINEAISAGVSGKWNGTRPPRPALCVYDGDGTRPSDGQPFGEECKGCWVFTASTRDKPFVVDNRLDDIIDPAQVYSGMWGNVCVAFFPYNYNGKKGIGCWLNGVQKIRDGEPLTHRVTAQSAFQVEEVPADSTTGGYDPITGQPVSDSSLPW